jgi:hypothetical protein
VYFLNREREPSVNAAVGVERPALRIAEGNRAQVVRPKKQPAKIDQQSTILVPISLAGRLSLVQSFELIDRESASFKGDGVDILGLNADDLPMITEALQAAARRLAEIQKRYAKVSPQSENTWLVEVATEANAPKSASIDELSADLGSIVGVEQADFILKYATNCLRLGPLKEPQRFLVKWNEVAFSISSTSYPYMFNYSVISTERLRSSLGLSWIEDMIDAAH